MTSNKKEIRWGILGLGKIAHKFASDLRLIPEARLAAVGSRDHLKAEVFKRQFQAHQAFDSYEALVQSADVDIIYIATPHVFHKEHALMCIEAGKHVLCEKPLAINSTEVNQMLKAAKRKKVFLMEALWTRFFPIMSEIHKRLERGDLGDIVLIEADFGFRAPYIPTSRIFNPELGGGALLDIGIYPVFLALDILGKPDHISASAVMSSTGVDKTTAIRLQWNNGALANLHCTIAAHTQITAKIYGTKQYIEIPRRWHESKEVKIWEGDRLVDHIVKNDEGLGYRYEIEAVHRDLWNGHHENAHMSHQKSADLIQTLDDIRHAIRLVYPADTNQ